MTRCPHCGKCPTCGQVVPNDRGINAVPGQGINAVPNWGPGPLNPVARVDGVFKPANDCTGPLTLSCKDLDALYAAMKSGELKNEDVVTVVSTGMRYCIKNETAVPYDL